MHFCSKTGLGFLWTVTCRSCSQILFWAFSCRGAGPHFKGSLKADNRPQEDAGGHFREGRISHTPDRRGCVAALPSPVIVCRSPPCLLLLLPPFPVNDNGRESVQTRFLFFWTGGITRSSQLCQGSGNMETNGILHLISSSVSLSSLHALW